MDPWLETGITSVVGGLVVAVVYLFRQSNKHQAAEADCQKRMARQDGQILTQSAMLEVLTYNGAINIDAVIVANLTTGLITEWNPSATMMLHWPAREMIGKSFTKLIPERYRDAHEQAVARVKSKDESPRRGPIVAFVLTKEGVEIPVNIFLSGWRDGQTPMVAAALVRRMENPGDSNPGR